MTMDFIFALSIALGFSIVFFAISLTLSMVEVSQYITFAAARAYNGANVSEQAQRELGTAKYNELKSSPVMRAILGSGWFSLGEAEFGNFIEDYPESNPDNDVFVGARIPFQAKILDLQIPFLGRTVENESVTGRATLNAYLMREVTTTECQEFNRARFNQLKSLDTHYQGISGTEALITDNGC